MGSSDILFVNVPFGPLLTPSLALSNFKALLKSEGFDCTVLYSHLSFADEIGTDDYHYIASGLPRAHDLFGEFLFSRALFGQQAKPSSAYLTYLDELLSSGRRRALDDHFRYVINLIRTRIDELRDHAVSFVERLACQIADRAPKIVGLTSAFQQNTASLALARRLRELNPNTKLLFGGANCEGAMGRRLFQLFPYIDAISLGEGEPILVPTIRFLLEEGPPPTNSSVLVRNASQRHASTNSKEQNLVDLNSLPLPDFSDFFSQAVGIALPGEPRLLFETSRGCWWGEKHHCTFCGLNGGTMSFRQKSPDLALAQIDALSASYPGVDICMTDNIIDHRYFRTFIPALAERGLNVDLFYEVKANLSKPQIALLSQAGVTRIQPGIESFSSSVLHLMRKGITGLQNIQLLKWCAEFGIKAEWNFLWGFPGEDPNEYHRMTSLIPHLVHLRPPNGVGRLRLDRFSPLFNSASCAFSNVRPFAAYELVYPLPMEDLKEIAYFFDGEFQNDIDPATYTEEIRTALQGWQSRRDAFLFIVDSDPTCVVFDYRKGLGPNGAAYVFTGLEREILVAGDGVSSFSALERTGLSSVESSIERLDHLGLIAIEGDRYIALPVQCSAQYPGPEVLRGMRTN